MEEVRDVAGAEWESVSGGIVKRRGEGGKSGSFSIRGEGEKPKGRTLVNQARNTGTGNTRRSGPGGKKVAQEN